MTETLAPAAGAFEARPVPGIAGSLPGGVPPVGACNTWRAFHTGTRKLTGDLMEHVHLEDNVLFPRFGA